MDDYALAIEQQLIGVLCWEREGYAVAAARLSASDFYDPRHRTIFAVIGGLVIDPPQSPLDPISVALELMRLGRMDEAGGPEYFARLAVSGTDPRKLAGLITKVADESVRRNLAAAMAAQATLVRDRTVGLDQIASHVRDAAVLAAKGAAPAEDTAIGASLERLLATFVHPESDPGLQTGIPELDEQIGGLQAGHLLTIAGATGSGKSSLASQIALGAAYAASQNAGRFGAAPSKVASVLYFSYEMGTLEIYTRLVAQCSPVGAAYRKGHGWLAQDKPVATMGARRIAELPLHVFDHAGSTVEDVRAEVDRFVVAHGAPCLVVVDYIGLMTFPGITNEVQGIGNITKGLKALARDHHVPVIQLAQINREASGGEGKDGHRPRLSDLRSSGSIEHDSNVVLLVYRPSYYLTDPAEKQAVEAKGAPVEVNVAKNRSGQSGSINMTWLGRRFLFVPDPAWTSQFGPAVVEGHGFIAYPVLGDAQAGTPAGRVIAALTAHYARTLAKCPRSALLEAFDLSLKAKWTETSILAPTIDAMVKKGQVLTAVEKNSALYWLPGQFPPALVPLDGGKPATDDEIEASDALFG